MAFSQRVYTYSLVIFLVTFIACAKKAEVDIAADSTSSIGAAPDGAMTQAPGISDQDRQFASKALAGNKAEIELGTLALTKAQMANVKEFAQMMITDHTKAYDELSQLATVKQLAADPAGAAELDSLKQKLTMLSGRAFDKEYISVMVKDHEKARDLYQIQATSGSDAELKAHAQKYLDPITQHLQHARGMDTLAGASAQR